MITVKAVGGDEVEVGPQRFRSKRGRYVAVTIYPAGQKPRPDPKIKGVTIVKIGTLAMLSRVAAHRLAAAIQKAADAHAD